MKIILIFALLFAFPLYSQSEIDNTIDSIYYNAFEEKHTFTTNSRVTPLGSSFQEPLTPLEELKRIKSIVLFQIKHSHSDQLLSYVQHLSKLNEILSRLNALEKKAESDPKFLTAIQVSKFMAYASPYVYVNSATYYKKETSRRTLRALRKYGFLSDKNNKKITKELIKNAKSNIVKKSALGLLAYGIYDLYFKINEKEIMKPAYPLYNNIIGHRRVLNSKDEKDKNNNDT